MPYRFVFTEWFDRNLKFLRKHNPTLREERIRLNPPTNILEARSSFPMFYNCSYATSRFLRRASSLA